MRLFLNVFHLFSVLTNANSASVMQLTLCNTRWSQTLFMLTMKDINYKSSCSILRPLNDPVAALSLHFSCCSQELRLMELKILICYLWRKDFKLWVLFLCAKKKKKRCKALGHCVLQCYY